MEDDTEVGLAYFGVRYYSAVLARWISAAWNGWPKSAPVVNFTNWHTYALEWTSNCLEFYQDGVIFGSVDPTSQSAGPVLESNMYIFFNLAIGGTLGGNATGLPDQTMEVHWVRHTAL